MRIAIAGIPSTGKTSLARLLAVELNTNLVHEYARHYISKYGDIKTVPEQYLITNTQYEWENNFTDFVTDSPIFLGFLYCIELHDPTVQKDRLWLAKFFKYLAEHVQYDIVFYLPPVLPVSRNGLRRDLHFDSNWREDSDMLLRSLIRLFPPKQLIEITTVELRDRVDEVLSHM